MPGEKVWVDDDELLRRCQQGDEAALETLAQRFQDRLFRLAYRVLGDEARAEEATVDALAVVWDRCGTWRAEARAATWIHQVALRVIIDHQRRLGAHLLGAQASSLHLGSRASSPRESPDPHDVLAAQENHQLTKDRVANALNQLSEEERALVHLHYFEELSLAEIAEILGTSRDALKMRLSRTREKLRPLLGDLLQ